MKTFGPRASNRVFVLLFRRGTFDGGAPFRIPTLCTRDRGAARINHATRARTVHPISKAVQPLVLAALLVGCQREQDSAGEPQAMSRLTGTVLYRERIALPADATIEVRLEDVSRADVPADLVAAQTIAPGGRQADSVRNRLRAGAHRAALPLRLTCGDSVGERRPPVHDDDAPRGARARSSC